MAHDVVAQLGHALLQVRWQFLRVQQQPAAGGREADLIFLDLMSYQSLLINRGGSMSQ